MEAVPITDSPHPVYCDTSTGTQRPIVPQVWHRTVFHFIHNLSHPGIKAIKISSPRVLFGQVSTQMSDVGRNPAFNVNVLRCRDTILPLTLHFLLPMLALALFILILLDLSLTHKVTPTSSPASIVSPTGQKPFLSPPSPLKLLHKLSVDGSQDSVFHISSSLIVNNNSESQL